MRSFVRFEKCVLFVALVFVGAIGSVSPAPAIVIEVSGAAARTPLSGRTLLFIARPHGKHPSAQWTPGFVATDVESIGFDARRGAPTPNGRVRARGLGALDDADDCRAFDE